MTFLRRRTLIGLSLIGSGLALGLVLSEIGLRLVATYGDLDSRAFLTQIAGPARHPNGMLVRHRTRGSALRNSFEGLAVTSDFRVNYRINSAGFRDREYARPKPVGARRVLALGDSFTFGEGIAEGERFTDLLEARANGTEVITLGVPGYGLDQIVVQFYEEVERWAPDEVWLFLNGVIVDRNHIGLVADGSLQMPECRSCSSSYVDRNSVLAPYTAGPRSYVLELTRFYWPFGNTRLPLAQVDAAFWRTAKLPKAKRRDIGAKSQSRTGVLLRELVSLCRTWKADLTVIGIDPWRSLSFVRQREGVSFVDLSEPLRAQAKTSPLTFRYDRHFNPETNRRIADELSSLVRN